MRQFRNTTTHSSGGSRPSGSELPLTAQSPADALLAQNPICSLLGIARSVCDAPAKVIVEGFSPGPEPLPANKEKDFPHAVLDFLSLCRQTRGQVPSGKDWCSKQLISEIVSIGVRLPPACGHDGADQQTWLRNDVLAHLNPTPASKQEDWTKLWASNPFAALEALRERVKYNTLPWGAASLLAGYFLSQDLKKVDLVLTEVERHASAHQPTDPTSLKVMMADIWIDLRQEQAGLRNLAKFMLRSARSFWPKDDRRVRERRFACLLIAQAWLIRDLSKACGDIEISARESLCPNPTPGQLDLTLPPAPRSTPTPPPAEEPQNVIKLKFG